MYSSENLFLPQNKFALSEFFIGVFSVVKLLVRGRLEGFILLVLPQEVEVGLHGKNIKYYEDKGYIIHRQKNKQYKWTVPKGTKILVNVEDLPSNSNKSIIFQCDYCKEYFSQNLNNSSRFKNYIDKDCCKKCSSIKIAEIVQIKYGVHHITELQWVKDSRVNTFLANYGVDNPMKNKAVQDKAKRTNNLRYGGDNPLNSKKVIEKQKQTLYKNGTQPCPTQQNYLYNLLGGKLNYPVSYLSLDIAFPEEMIYLEYDGSGHDLSVKYGDLTQEEFNKKERNRRYFLKSKKWDEIRIISRKDYIPQDEVIFQMIEYAKDYLSTGHSWITFDIDNNKIKTSQFKYNIDYGELRKIRKAS